MDSRHWKVSIQPAEDIQARLLSSGLQGTRPGDAVLTLQLLRLQAQHQKQTHIPNVMLMLHKCICVNTLAKQSS